MRDMGLSYAETSMSDLYDRIRAAVEMFETYLCDYENVSFTSLQGAYRDWLENTGFALFGDDYTMGVQVILVFLSRCIANPRNRLFLVDDTDEEIWAPLQVSAPDIRGRADEQTFWEFFTEENFQAMYARWAAA